MAITPGTTIRFTPAEMTQLDKQAEAAQMNKSDYLRYLLKNARHIPLSLAPIMFQALNHYADYLSTEDADAQSKAEALELVEQCKQYIKKFTEIIPRSLPADDRIPF